jgi:hypothetical protein
VTLRIDNKFQLWYKEVAVVATYQRLFTWSNFIYGTVTTTFSYTTTLYSTPDTDIDSHRPTTGHENSHTY